MKNYFIAFAAATLACLSNFALHAQAPATKTAVYFGVSADSLDAKARASLDSFAQIAKSNPDIELLVTAYTDDRGNTDKNKALATRRANAVVAHLSQHSIATRRENIAAKGELALNENTYLDIEAQRQQNRRVEITLTTFAPQNLTEFYDYQARKNTQVFNIDNKKADYISGQKGGKLIIPPNAFVCKTDKSAPALPIKIELREAYTFGDMILQNLTTSSGANILQTGGMMYIAATDANGKALELKADKEITVAMPMPQTPLDSMQLFLSDRAGDHNTEASDWASTNTLFRNNFSNGGNNRGISGTGVDFFGCTSKDFAFGKNPYKNEPLRSKQRVIFPKKIVANPKASQLVEPKLEKTFIAQKDFQSQNPRQDKEAKKAYKARINTAYAAYTAEYEAARKKYDADLAAYQKEKQTTQNNFAAYKKYQDSLELAFFTLYKEHYTLFGVTANEHDKMNNYMRCAVATLTDHNNFHSRKLSMEHDLSRPEFAEVRQEIQKYINTINSLDTAKCRKQLQQLDSLHRNSVAFKMTNQPLLNFYNQKQPKQSYSPPTQESAGIKFHRAFCEMNKDDNADFSGYAQEYIDTFGRKIETLAYLQESKDFEAYLAEIEIEKIIKANEHIRQLENNAEILYNAKKAELGELTDEALLSQLPGNLTQVNRLGWINCDKFYKTNPEMLSNVVVDCAPNRNMLAYAVIPTMSSILNLESYPTNYMLPGNGVPKNLMVKFVFIQVESGKVKFAIQESASRPTDKIVPQFKVCTPTELEESLRNI